MTRFRWWAQFRAWRGGWFWLPCPVCGQHFAGFESAEVKWWDTETTGRLICRKPGCIAAAQDHNSGIKTTVYTIHPGDSFTLRNAAGHDIQLKVIETLASPVEATENQ